MTDAHGRSTAASTSLKRLGRSGPSHVTGGWWAASRAFAIDERVGSVHGAALAASAKGHVGAMR